MQRLLTEAGTSLAGIPWDRYPRPQMVREDWLCLNGPWTISRGETREKITVPFCPESLLSGTEMTAEYGEAMEYSRKFTVPKTWKGKRVLLHFGAVSRIADVKVNGVAVAHHEESYLPFSADITDALVRGKNTLRVTAVNDLSPRHCLGKQKEKRGGMWYTPVSGIWQTVWLEPVPERHITDLKITTGEDWAEIRTGGADEGTVIMDGEEYPLRGGCARIRITDPHRWSPDDPYLYRFTVRCGEDCVKSYFALRTLSVQTVREIPRLCLNGEPFFFHGVLDQGYWSDGLYTPADPESYERDILAMKALGFNTLRKHVKIEPEQFYYDCDRLGMIVFQDMVNCGEYSFARDTALPSVGIGAARDDRELHPDPETRKNFLLSLEATVKLLGNHPCICLWTIFNEGWGQFRADDAYDRLKALDPSRFIDSTSGWFRQKKSDVESLHRYFGKLKTGTENRPQLLSEFGGWSLKDPEHSFNPEKTYGYRKYTDRDTFARELKALYATQVLPLALRGLCGAIYTQVSDVEDETNGLLTFDRRKAKVTPEDLEDIAFLLQDAMRV